MMLNYSPSLQNEVCQEIIKLLGNPDNSLSGKTMNVIKQLVEKRLTERNVKLPDDEKFRARISRDLQYLGPDYYEFISKTGNKNHYVYKITDLGILFLEKFDGSLDSLKSFACARRVNRLINSVRHQV